MTGDVKPIRSEADYEAALQNVARLWGAKAGTHEGDRLDVLTTLIEAYEAQHFPIDPPRTGGLGASIAAACNPALVEC